MDPRRESLGSEILSKVVSAENRDSFHSGHFEASEDGRLCFVPLGSLSDIAGALFWFGMAALVWWMGTVARWPILLIGLVVLFGLLSVAYLHRVFTCDQIILDRGRITVISRTLGMVRRREYQGEAMEIRSHWKSSDSNGGQYYGLCIDGHWRTKRLPVTSDRREIEKLRHIFEKAIRGK